MKTSTKVTLTLFVATFVTLGILIYKGYRVVPLVNINQYKSDKGTTITGLKIEMYNPIKDKGIIEEKKEETSTENSK